MFGFYSWSGDYWILLHGTTGKEHNTCQVDGSNTEATLCAP